MNPLRLLLLAALFYLAYRLLRGARSSSSTTMWDSGSGPDSLKHDILIEDPVCHTYVPKSQAVPLDKGEKIYYFCSKKCRDVFCSEEEQDS
jgi:YHS domain-containing protein